MATGFEKFMRAAGTAASRLRRDHATGLAAEIPAKSAAKIPARTSVVAILGSEELDALDAWIAARPEPRPPRSEAIRLLVNEALGRK
jgi:hypothetical protein